MKRLLNTLSGKKTYLGWAAVVVYGLLVHFAVVENNEAIWIAIATWTGVSYRMAINKS